MKIRTQLILAFLLLAVLPLTGIVSYSYVTSIRAVQRAEEVAARGAAERMERRLESVQLELDRRVALLGELPQRKVAEMLAKGQKMAAKELHSSLIAELGEAAPLVESLEFVPAEPAAPSPVSPRHGTPTDHKREPSRIESAGLEQPTAIVISELVEVMKEMTVQPRLEMSSDPATGTQAGIAIAIEIGERIEEAMTHEAERIAAAEVQLRSLSSPTPRTVLTPIRAAGEVIGQMKASISSKELLKSVLRRTDRTRGELPFAIDEDGSVLSLADDQELVSTLVADLGDASSGVIDSWVLASQPASGTGLTFGIARPLDEPLAAVRSTAVRNFGWGLGLIGLAALCIFPLTARMTRELGHLSHGVQQIAGGDLEARVSVESHNELGELSQAFNRMAHELAEQRGRLLLEEEHRHQQEVERKLLKAEFDRKSLELSEARDFQLSLLPDRLPEHSTLEVAVFMRTATEVGGDYYDFRSEPDGSLITAIGDATGHGARAGTMVTAVKSLFTAAPEFGGVSEFLEQTQQAIRRMRLGRMAMALSVLRLSNHSFELSSAGMPPALLYNSKSNEIEELAVPGMPLGGIDVSYRSVEHPFTAGDTLLLMSDGLPELRRDADELYGYDRVRRAFQTVAQRSPQAILDHLNDEVDRWLQGTDSGAPQDDVTFVILRRSKL